MSVKNEANENCRPRTVLEIDVRNHAGVMSHVVGLFARRACNIEGIVCYPPGDGTTSRIWLLVDDNRLTQMSRHLANLEDVLAVRRCDGPPASFDGLCQVFRP